MKNVIIVQSPTEAAQRATDLLERALADLPELTTPTVFAIGGDGTMLRAIRDHRAINPLFVGISAGHLGFLQSFEPSQIEAVIEALVGQTYQTIQAPLLAAADHTGAILGYAFNDISVERAGARASRLHVHIDGSAGSFIGDGVIFATAFGSTAYSLAAGGPIIDTRAEDVFVVTPNNPHVSVQYSSLQRPHILKRGRQVHLSVKDEDLIERPTKLVIDGETVLRELTSAIDIFLSDQTVTFLELEPDGFHSRLEAKRLGRS